MKNRGMKVADGIITSLIYVFLYAPLLIMVLFSFNSGRSTSVFEGFSFKWYVEMFSRSDIMNALKNTLILAVLSSAIATVLGTVAAVGIYNLKNKYVQSTMMTVTNIPMMNPDIVTGVSLMLLFVFVGTMVGSADKLNFFTLLIAHITFNLPYVILNVLPKLRQTDRRIYEAAQDLGAPPVKAFFMVVMPSIMPGIISGLMMSFTLSLDDFVISYYTNGTGFQTLPLMIFSMTKKTVKPDMYALSSLIFVTVLLLLVLSNVVKAKSVDESPKKKKAKRIGIGVVAAAVCVCLVVAIVIPKNKSSMASELQLEGDYSGLEGTTLNIINWGEYISDGSEDTLDVIKAFEEVSGIDVNYDDSTASNEAMYSKLKSGAVSVDIVIPSDYMIQRMISEGMLRKVDTSKISNYKYIDEQYKGQYFDPKDEYSVPYNVGLVGVIYDSTVVTETPDSWSIMWDEKYAGDILNFNNPRDSFATAQFYLGLDINSTDRAEWKKAAEKLKEQNSVLQGRVMDEIFNKMEGGNAAVAPYYAGDFLTMQDVNPDLEFFYPKEGTNIFIDSMCVPSSAQNYEAALMFINFMLEPDVALANAEYLCYATPNTAVLNNDEYSLKGNKYLYPDTLPPVEYYHDLPNETRAYYESLWEEIVR